MWNIYTELYVLNELFLNSLIFNFEKKNISNENENVYLEREVNLQQVFC